MGYKETEDGEYMEHYWVCNADYATPFKSEIIHCRYWFEDNGFENPYGKKRYAAKNGN